MAVAPFWYHFWTFNIFEFFEGFYCWNHCFLSFLLKKSPSFWGVETGFPSRNFWAFSAGEIALLFFFNFEILNLLITPLIMAVEPIWYHFLTFNIFELFEDFYCSNHFCYHFFWKITKFLRGGDGFTIKKFSTRFTRGKSLLNFLNLKILNLLITP